MYYIALENIRSLLNIGAIFRTCSFFGIKDVILVGYTGIDLNGKLHPKITKSSLGTENDLDITILKNARKLISFAKNKNLQVISVEQHRDSVDLNSWQPPENYILVFGNEVDGIDKKILANSKQIVQIPKKGKHKSLNVTTTVGIVLNHLELL